MKYSRTRPTQICKQCYSIVQYFRDSTVNSLSNAGSAAMEATSLAALQGKTRSLAALMADLTGSDLAAQEKLLQCKWRVRCCCRGSRPVIMDAVRLLLPTCFSTRVWIIPRKFIFRFRPISLRSPKPKLAENLFVETEI